MEDYGYSQNGMLSGLDAQTVSAMKAAETNWNDEFKNGKIWNGFEFEYVNGKRHGKKIYKNGILEFQ